MSSPWRIDGDGGLVTPGVSMLPGGGGGVGPREERGATPSPSLGQGLSTFPTSAKRPRTSDSWNQRNPYQKALRHTLAAATAPSAPQHHSTTPTISSPDLVDFLANRCKDRESHEQQVANLEAKVAELHAKLRQSEQQRRFLAAECESQASMHNKDVADLEDALKQATLQAAKAMQQCEQAEAKAGEKRNAKLREEQRLRKKLEEAEEAASHTQHEAIRLSAEQLAMAQALLSEEQLQARDTARRAKTMLERERAQTEAADAARKETEGRLGRLEAQLAEAEGRAASAERKCCSLEAEAKIQLQAQLGPTAAAEELQVLRRQLQAAQGEAAQVKVLRQHVANVDLLREQLATHESRNRRLQQELEAYRGAQLQLSQAEAAVALWKSAAASLGADCNSPEDIPRRAADLQREALRATELQGAAAREERRLKMKIEEMESDAASLCRKEEAARQQAEGTAAALAREQRKVSLLQGERDGLKRILASYDQEKENMAKEGATPSTDTLKATEALRQLEALQAEARRMEDEIKEKEAAKEAALAKAASFQEKLADQEAAGRRLEMEAERLGAEVALLNEKLGRGEFNPSKTKVLHLIANPEAQALKEAEKSQMLVLAAERDALAAQVAQLQGRLDSLQPGEAADGVMPGGSAAAPRQIAVLEAEKVVLQRQVAEIEKRELRLKEVFRERIQAFREACYQLFGYRVDMASESSSRGAGASAATSFVLKPARADSKDDHLMFRFTQSGGMEILETPFTAEPSRQREVQTFVHKFRSIPAFTANLTMELFQKQTQC